MDRKMSVTSTARTALFLVFAALVGCESTGAVGPGTGQDPRSLEGSYDWVLERWDQGVAQGYPRVLLSWELPAQYDREVFRVYARRVSGGSYTLIATVTSCAAGICEYSDINVSAGQGYEYYIATVDGWDGAERGVSTTIRVDVPQRPNVTVPAAPTAIGLDAAVYLRWTSTGAQRYLVLSQEESGTVFLIGDTDGTSFYDDRAENGVRYRYYLAGVDGAGHVSNLGAAAEAFPRPDYHADIVYATEDHVQQSGFRFVTRETDDPIVPGSSSEAQWRIEAVGGVLHIRPLGQTAITGGAFTTQLTCGPGSDADCVDIRLAPTAGQFGSVAVPVRVGNTYVLRVVAADGQTRYAKVRVQGATTDTEGRRLVVFDWAYQLRPGERSLNLGV